MRNSFVIRALAALIALAPVVGAQGAPATNTTIIVVRHAEKAAEPAADPPLTAAGAARAESLAEVVRDAGVNVIVSTQYQRTRQTVAPTAWKLSIVAEVIDARVSPRATADTLLARYRGRTVLVAGHSNTVPAIVAALGAPQPADICDAGYDNMFVVTVPPSGAATVTRLHFGVATQCMN
ncbi:MAG: histidine phosphatase family protein [bacterium]